MKDRNPLSLFLYIFISYVLIVIGCSAPVLEMPKSVPSTVKAYRSISVYANNPVMVNSGIFLNKGEAYSLLVKGEVSISPTSYFNRPEEGLLVWLIGKNEYSPMGSLWISSARTFTATDSGELRLGISDGGMKFDGMARYPERYRNNSGFFSVDIIVWEKADFVQIVDFFEKMKERGPPNKAVDDALKEAKEYREIYLAEREATKEIEKTEKEIAALKEESKIKEQLDVQTQEKIGKLESKLEKLTTTLAQLEEMKRQLDEEKMKTSLLTKELEEKEKREKELLTRLEDTSKTPPVIAIASPIEGSKVEIKIITFSGVAEDDQGLQNLEVFINDEPLQNKIGRGIRLPEARYPKRIDFRERIPLQKGENKIKIRAVDSDGLSSEKVVTVQYIEKRRNVWAVVIGIDHYPNIRQLKYAVDDAEMFYDHLVKYNRIPPENVILLTDQQATLRKVKSTLGTDLKNKAGKEDMVIIFFAGHGATEKDVMSPDGDGLEKYLLPYDADPRDLYATALPMREISGIFRRVRSERLVFIADSCYSGASGGRTVGITDIRANLSEAFLDRIASGKGRVILTASGPNEVSAEKDELKHGVFSYYLVEGLRGRADFDKDGLISLDELYRYVSNKVPEVTGQEQHPMKKGTVEGRLILGVIQ